MDVIKKRFLLPVIVLTILLSISFVSWFSIEKSVESVALSRFEETVTRESISIQSTVNFYLNVLYAAQGFYETNPPASSEEYSEYFKRLIHPETHPGILAMAFVERVENKNLSAFVGGVRRQDYPDFKISPLGERSEYYVIRHIEPQAGNMAALGVDLYALPDRRSAIEVARDTGQITSTSQVKLFASGENKPGVVIFAPVYKNSTPLLTVEQRRDNIIGEIDATIVAEKLFGAISLNQEEMAFEVFDGTNLTKENLLYDSDKEVNPFGSYKPRVVVEKRLNIANQVWVLRFYSLAGFKLSSFTELAPIVTLVIGILLSFLIAFIVYILSATRERAIIVANNITKELKFTNLLISKKAEELATKNEIINAQVKSLGDSKKAMLNVLEDMKQSEEKFHSLVDSMNEGLGVQDGNGIITFMNKRGCEMLGYKPEELIGKPISIVFDKENLKIVQDQMIKRRKGGRQSYEVSWLCKDRSLMPTIIAPSPRFDKNGNFIGSVAVFIDITERKQVEQKLLEIDKAKSEFISIASHQLRTPVSGLNWLIEALEFNSKDFNPQQKRYVKDLAILARRLVGLIEDLLNFSRIQLKAGTVMIKDRIEIGSFVREFINEIVPYANLKKHEIVCRSNVAKPLVVVMNKKSLYNVIQNLVTNAIDYSPADTAVTINLEQVGDFAKISVSNKGPHIPKEEMIHLFERFYRAESTKKIKPEGTGLGLYIAKAVVEEMGGQIGLDDRDGEDTTFWFTIPLERDIMDKVNPDS